MDKHSALQGQSIKATDLRGILKYVPMFRDHIFVIAIDGSLVAHPNFQDVLLDIAVLRSLNIQIILVHGIGEQLNEAAAESKLPISDAHGEFVTDDTTLDLATKTASLVTQKLVRGLTKNDLRSVVTNAVRSKASGIHKGVEYQHSGTVDKIDTELISQLLCANTIPVFAPIALDREGAERRLNSDVLARELALKMRASKLIYLTTQDPLCIDGVPTTSVLLADLTKYVDEDISRIPERLRSKVLRAIEVVDQGVPRCHILDGRLFGALLDEIFDKVGIGTMIYRSEYLAIRSAKPDDIDAIHNLTERGIRNESLRSRTLSEISNEISNYLIYEIDGSIVGCVHLATSEDKTTVEIGQVYVQEFYQNRGIGRRMIEFACSEAKAKGVKRAVALTTQANDFFVKICGFEDGDLSMLSPTRVLEYKANGRNSRILFLDL